MNEAVVQVPATILRALVGMSVVGVLAVGFNLGARSVERKNKQ